MITFKLFENILKGKYYRAIEDFVGDDITIDIKHGGYYEAIDDNNLPIFMYGEHLESEVLEIAASKYIGGAVMGSFSMTQSKTYYIYEINNKPDKDISNWDGGDFEYLEEVRYRKSIKAKYIGKVVLSEQEFFILESFYMIYGEDREEELPEERLKIVDLIEDGELSKILKKIKV